MKKRILSGLLALLMLAALIPVAAVSAETTGTEGNTAGSYADYYVKDGLVALYDAFDSSRINLVTGAWVPTVGTENAQIYGGAKSESNPAGWYMDAAGGVGYRFTSLNDYIGNSSNGWLGIRRNYGINLADSFAGLADFTVETTAIFAGLTDAEGNHIFTQNKSNAEENYSQYNAHDGGKSAFRFGMLQSLSFIAPRKVWDSTTESWIYYGNANDSLVNRWHYSYAAGNDGSKVKQIAAENMVNQLKSPKATFTLTWTRQETGNTGDSETAVQYWQYMNGGAWKNPSLTVAEVNKYAELQKAYADANDGKQYDDAASPFSLFNGYPATVYTIRVYNRALSAEEIKANRAVDVLQMGGISYAEFAALSEKGRSFLLSQVTGINFMDNDFSKKVKEAFDAVKKSEEAAVVKTAYDSLYIGANGETTANGGRLFTLLSAFGADSSVLYNNVWKDKMGNYDASLIGDWKAMTEGGIGYDISQKSDDTYMQLPLEALPDGNYAVEVIGSVRGWTKDAAGKEVVSTNAMYGIVAGDHAAFSFGPMHAFLYTGVGAADYTYHNYSSNKLLTVYNDGTPTWGESNMKWEHVKTYTDTADTAASAAPDLSVVASVIMLKRDGQDYYSFYKNGTLLTTLRTGWWGGKTSTVVEKNDTQSFIFFRSTGTTALSVRVYDAMLTEAEMAYNHFIDLAAYAGVDIAAFAALPASLRAGIAENFKNTAFSTDGSTLTAAIAAATEPLEKAKADAVTYVGIAARLSGKTAEDADAGIRSLYAVNDAAIETLEQYYNVAYGAVMGISAFGGTTWYANASDLKVTGNSTDGFTAAGAHAACVTVYGTTDATGLYLTDADGAGNRGFAYTTVYGGKAATKECYEMGMVYAAFLALTDKTTGETEILYISAAGDTFAENGAPVTMKAVAEYFLTNGYADNAILQKVADACKTEAGE